jgi:hypothetical protein
MSGARIEVYHHDINDKYRQIELAGTPVDISRAAEKIYKIVNKYYFVAPGNNERRDSSLDRSSKKRKTDEPRSRIRLMRTKKRGKE